MSEHNNPVNFYRQFVAKHHSYRSYFFFLLSCGELRKRKWVRVISSGNLEDEGESQDLYVRDVLRVIFPFDVKGEIVKDFFSHVFLLAMRKLLLKSVETCHTSM